MQDDPAWRHSVLVDLETLVEAIPKPRLDAPLDASLVRIRNQLAANLELTLPPVSYRKMLRHSMHVGDGGYGWRPDVANAGAE